MFTEQPSRHEMVLVSTHETGAEEWYCPTCGRRFLMQWPPEYKKVILECGDENAIHSGGKGGVRMETPQVTQVFDQEDDDYLPDPEEQEDEIFVPVKDETLLPWLEWMEKAEFERLWDKEL